MVGIAPLGFVVGASASEHLSTAAGAFSAWAIFGASAQLATTELLGAGVGVGTVILTGLVINARLLAYSASMARHWKHESLGFKALAAATIVEPTFALGSARYEHGETTGRRDYYVGAAITLWFGWMGAVLAGALLGLRLDLPGISLLVPLSLVAMVTPSLKQKASRAAVVTALVIVVVGSAFGGAGLIVPAVAGAVAGAVAEGRS
jgi:predicted branched-subunit amino acid permease